ncbi:uncharacterized protein LAJ45_10445 [Morchella importuna]|uniref:uncharacterized protein n=1 Tax=Morchella importuna TaxID=1174673 RepID=UPI001E8E2052|nr:uncharacterized protein LAJ45_10445 [Morchella importuna]KAH8145475.1 hypothetical protein LAJ45_10445 [Morchella importuna]
MSIKIPRNHESLFLGTYVYITLVLGHRLVLTRENKQTRWFSPNKSGRAPNLTQSVARIPFLRGFLEAPCRYNLPRYPYLSDISSHLLIRYRGALFFLARTGINVGQKFRLGKIIWVSQEGGFQEFQN